MLLLTIQDQNVSFCTRKIHLEVAVQSVADAQAAWQGGADRLELCQALDLGGLTPSLGLFLEIQKAVPLPMVVMLRPRAGPFQITAWDFKVMQRDLDLFLTQGAAGVVFGLLTKAGHIDMPRCQRLLRQAGGAATVFHRAFDLVSDQHQALEQLLDLGCSRLLTSGQADQVLAGANTIKTLVRLARGRLEVMPGGGIRAENVECIVRTTGCAQVHGSFRRRPRRSTYSSRAPQASGSPQVNNALPASISAPESMTSLSMGDP